MDSNGDEQTASGWSITDYLRININSESVYNIPTPTTSDAVMCWFYDRDKIKINPPFQTRTSGKNILQPPTNAKYVRFSIKTDDKDNFTYKSILFMPYENGSVIPTSLYNSIERYSFKNDIYVGCYRNTSGSIAYNSNWAMTPLYKVREGDVFTMNKPFSQYLTCYDINKENAFPIIGPNSDNPSPVNYVIPTSVSYISVNIRAVWLGTVTCTLNGAPLGVKYDMSWIFDAQHTWSNKSYISHGDSITWQDGKEYIQGEHIGEIAKGYQTVLQENTGLDRIYNQGKSGWSMATVNGNGVVNTIIAVSSYFQFDLCTIACGTNDFKLNVPLGTIGVIGDVTFDDTTFYGAYRKAVEYILMNSPKIRLVLMTPLQRNNSGYDVNYINSAGHKLIDYVNAVKEIGEIYGLPVCDMYRNSGFTKLTLNTYTMDGLHPNDVGYKRMGDYLTQFLNSIGT